MPCWMKPLRRRGVGEAAQVGAADAGRELDWIYPGDLAEFHRKVFGVVGFVTPHAPDKAVAEGRFLPLGLLRAHAGVVVIVVIARGLDEHGVDDDGGVGPDGEVHGGGRGLRPGGGDGEEEA